MVGKVTELFIVARAELHLSRVLLLLSQREVGRGHLSSSRLRDNKESQIALRLRDLLLGRVEAEVVVGAPLIPEAHRVVFLS